MTGLQIQILEVAVIILAFYSAYKGVKEGSLITIKYRKLIN